MVELSCANVGSEAEPRALDHRVGEVADQPFRLRPRAARTGRADEDVGLARVAVEHRRVRSASSTM